MFIVISMMSFQIYKKNQQTQQWQAEPTQRHSFQPARQPELTCPGVLCVDVTWPPDADLFPNTSNNHILGQASALLKPHCSLPASKDLDWRKCGSSFPRDGSLEMNLQRWRKRLLFLCCSFFSAKDTMFPAALILFGGPSSRSFPHNHHSLFYHMGKMS